MLLTAAACSSQYLGRSDAVIGSDENLPHPLEVGGEVDIELPAPHHELRQFPRRRNASDT